jgi:hypothetical protein
MNSIQFERRLIRSGVETLLNIVIYEPLRLAWMPIRAILGASTTFAITVILLGYLLFFFSHVLLPAAAALLFEWLRNPTDVSTVGCTISSLSMFSCGLVGLGCLPGNSTTQTGTAFDVDPRRLHQEVASANEVILGLNGLENNAMKITTQSVHLVSLT